jgi:hypothetical protein
MFKPETIALEIFNLVAYCEQADDPMTKVRSDGGYKTGQTMIARTTIAALVCAMVIKSLHPSKQQ